MTDLDEIKKIVDNIALSIELAKEQLEFSKRELLLVLDKLKTDSLPGVDSNE